ncbi:MAG: GNAT family N-acetyltransferase [Pararhodobacter sp.]|nr:GNAT family N-acetyltransferase [Pararhodobacter sp.]
MNSGKETAGGGQPVASGAQEPALHVRLARNGEDIRAAQRLRYRVFVQELGASGDTVDHAQQLEIDPLDEACDHLLLIDRKRDEGALDQVVGVYRLLSDEAAARVGRFYCDAEYDLSPLRNSGRRLVELSRSCVHRDYRRGPAMMFLWQGVAEYVLRRGIEIMFGVASFGGTDPERHAQALSLLHHFHLAPPALRPLALPGHFQPMDLIAPDAIDQVAALASMPALIRAYLRLGGFVGEGAFVDHAFNTVDVCLIMDTTAMSARHVGYYTRRMQRMEGAGDDG